MHDSTSQDAQALTTSLLAGASAVLAEVGGPPAVAWTTVLLGLISLASLWIRGYWSDREAVVELRLARREIDRLRRLVEAGSRSTRSIPYSRLPTPDSRETADDRPIHPRRD